MTNVWTEAEQRARVRVACDRIAGAAAAVLVAHRLGTAEGPHVQPWTLGYARDAMQIYAESLPLWYQNDIAELFDRSARIMDGCTIPAPLSADWVIVTDYMVSARSASLEWFASLELKPHRRPSNPSRTAGRQADPPPMIRFDDLARLTTSDGARRLERAAINVHKHMEAPDPQILDERELELLKRAADGATIADLAAAMGYSERSAFRMLASLWKKLGVRDRNEGVRKAVEAGLLN